MCRFLRSGLGSAYGNHSQVLVFKKNYDENTHFIAKREGAIFLLTNRFTHWRGTEEVGVTRHTMVEIYMKWSNCFEDNNSLSHGQSCFERFRLQTYSIRYYLNIFRVNLRGHGTEVQTCE